MIKFCTKIKILIILVSSIFLETFGLENKNNDDLILILLKNKYISNEQKLIALDKQHIKISYEQITQIKDFNEKILNTTSNQEKKNLIFEQEVAMNDIIVENNLYISQRETFLTEYNQSLNNYNYLKNKLYPYSKEETHILNDIDTIRKKMDEVVNSIVALQKETTIEYKRLIQDQADATTDQREALVRAIKKEVDNAEKNLYWDYVRKWKELSKIYDSLRLSVVHSN